MQGRLNEWNALCHARREVRFRAFAYCFMGDGPKKIVLFRLSYGLRMGGGGPRGTSVAPGDVLPNIGVREVGLWVHAWDRGGSCWRLACPNMGVRGVGPCVHAWGRVGS